MFLSSLFLILHLFIRIVSLPCCLYLTEKIRIIKKNWIGTALIFTVGFICFNFYQLFPYLSLLPLRMWLVDFKTCRSTQRLSTILREELALHAVVIATCYLPFNLAWIHILDDFEISLILSPLGPFLLVTTFSYSIPLTIIGRQKVLGEGLKTCPFKFRAEIMFQNREKDRRVNIFRGLWNKKRYPEILIPVESMMIMISAPPKKEDLLLQGLVLNKLEAISLYLQPHNSFTKKRRRTCR